MKNYFKFTYRSGKPVRDHGKIVLLEKSLPWGDVLQEGCEYIIENPKLMELEKCIIIKSGKFLRVDEIAPTYQVSGGPYIEIDKSQINFGVRRTVAYREEVISSDTDYNNFTFGLTGGEEFYNLLPKEAKQQVDDFRVWMTWIIGNQLVVLDGGRDFSARCGFRLQSETEFLKVETTCSGSAEQPKGVSVVKLQTLIYEPFFQNGFEPAISEESREVTNRLGTVSLEESGLSFSFRPVWKSPTLMVGKLTINGEGIEGLVKLPGDGTGSYLDAVMYLGLMEMPPSTLSDNDMSWLDSGGRICWVYDFDSKEVIEETIKKASKDAPTDPASWVKIANVCDGTIRYIQDTFHHEDYEKLVEVSRSATAQKDLVPHFENQISSVISIPSEMPFYLGWSTTDLGMVLRNRFQTLKAEMIEGLTLENSAERIETVKTKAEEIKTEISAEYEKAQALIASTEESFEKTLAEVEQDEADAEPEAKLIEDDRFDGLTQSNDAMEEALRKAGLIK